MSYSCKRSKAERQTSNWKCRQTAVCTCHLNPINSDWALTGHSNFWNLLLLWLDSKINQEAVVLLKGFFLCARTGTFFTLCSCMVRISLLVTGIVKRHLSDKKNVYGILQKQRYSWSYSLKDWLKVAAALLLYLNSKSVFKFQDFYCLCHFQVKLHAKNGSLFDYCYHYWIKYALFSQKKDAIKYIYIKIH